VTLADMERADKIALKWFNAKRGNFRELSLMDAEDLAQEILAISLETGNSDYEQIVEDLSRNGRMRRTRHTDMGMLEVSMADLSDDEYRQVYNQMYGAYPDEDTL